MAEDVSIPEIFEMPIKRKNISNPFKIEIDTRHDVIAKLIQRKGIRGTRKYVKALAEQLKVSERMVYIDIKWAVGHYTPTNLREAKIELSIARDEALTKAMDNLSLANTPDDTVRAIAAVIAASKHYREEMEAWGEKEKIAEKHEVTGKVFNVNFNLPEGEKIIEFLPHDARDKLQLKGSDDKATGSVENVSR
jgi:hypothetical protein